MWSSDKEKPMWSSVKRAKEQKAHQNYAARKVRKLCTISGALEFQANECQMN